MVKKEKIVGIRVTWADWAFLLRRAKELRLTVSQYVRLRIFGRN